MKNPTIFQLTPFFSPNVGGVETHLDDLIGFLGKKNYKTIVLTYQALTGKVRGKRNEVKKNLEIIRIPWFSNLFYKTQRSPLLHFLYLTPCLLFYGLAFMIRRGGDIDIIHAHGINAAYVGAIIKILFGKPLAISMHVEINLKKNSLLTKALLWPLSKANKVLVLTQSSKEKLEALGINKDRTVVYSYWVDQDKFIPRNKEEVRARLGIKSDKFVALFVGRLAEEKGVRLVLEAAEKLKDLDLYIAGGGSLEGEVKKYSKKLRNIHYLGVLANDDLPLYYNLSDVLVVPSLVKNPRPTFEEGVPRVIIEALSCGLPVVGTDNGGVKEVIEKGKVGIVVKSTAEAFVSALQNLQKDSGVLGSFERNCRAYSVERFGPLKPGIFLNIYKRLNIMNLVSILLENTGDMALKRRARWLIEELDPEDGDRILDVGCGDGYYLFLLSSLGMRIELTGVDSDEKALRSATKNLEGRNIKLVHADLMRTLPFKEGSFNKAVMSEVAEHLSDDFKGLREVGRVLKKGGLLAISVPSHNYPLFWDPVSWVLEHLLKTHIERGFWAGIWNQHLRLYTPVEIERVVNKAGLEVARCESLTWWCLPFNHNIVNLVARNIYGGNISAKLKTSINKFKVSREKPILINLAFRLVNAIDKLNDIYYPRSRGVGVLVKARKIK